MWARRFSPSKQRASSRPLPSIFITCAYSGGRGLVGGFWRVVYGLLREEEGRGRVVPCPSSLKVSSRFSLSFSFFPRRRFLPPCAVC